MKKVLFSSIRSKIVIVVIIMISIPFVILQVTNMLLIYGKLQQKTSYTTQALSKSIATNVSEFMSGTYNAAELLASNEMVVEGNKAGSKVLSDAVKRMPFFRLLYVQKANGMQTIRSSGQLANRSDRWWFRKLIAEPRGFISDAYISVYNNELVTSVFLPMFQEGKLNGIFGADFTLNTIQNATGQYWNKDISYIVLDSKGSVLTSSDYKPGEYINYIDFTKRTVVLDKNKKYVLDKEGQIVTKADKIEVTDTIKKIITNAIGKKAQTFQFRDKGNIVACAYQPIKLPGNSTSWSVIVFQKQTDYLTLMAVFLMFIILIGFSIFITFKVINSSVLTPVLKIQNDMTKIAEGKLDVRIDIDEKNEIGELAGNINKMVESLKFHQQRLDDDEKMAALGHLVAGVAHEINTPLGIGVTTASYMQKINNEYRLALNEGRFSKNDLIEYMETMNDSLDILQFNLERGSKIIHSFKKIAVDQSSEELEDFNVFEYINGIVLSLVHEYKRSNHVINIDCNENIIIRSYPGVFAQIITNFIMNSLTHGFKDRENGNIIIRVEVKEDKFILSYSDNGCGISQDKIKNIFTPYYTTNKKLGGSGLGLSVVYNLVTKKLNGSITAHSKEGEGTLFVITIPMRGVIANAGK